MSAGPNNFRNVHASMSAGPNNFRNVRTSMSSGPNNFRNVRTSMSAAPNNFRIGGASMSAGPNNFRKATSSMSSPPKRFSADNPRRAEVERRVTFRLPGPQVSLEVQRCFDYEHEHRFAEHEGRNEDLVEEDEVRFQSRARARNRV